MTAGLQQVAASVDEERRRLARDLHDGVIQQIVALAYRLDDVSDLVGPGPASAAIASFRDELSGLARDVRCAVEDLRSGPSAGDGLSAALSAYAGELGRSGDLRVHLHLDERAERLPARGEHEVLMIAREAIANVRRHARAVNLWIRLVSDGHRMSLVVEDDGVGGVLPRPGHFGLQGMRERAEQIGADLAIAVRQDGGTVVTLSLGVPAPPRKEGDDDVDRRLARR
jgi:signal transduction histidine kinase